MSGDETEKKAAPAKTSIMASLSGNWFVYDIPASKYPKYKQFYLSHNC